MRGDTRAAENEPEGAGRRAKRLKTESTATSISTTNQEGQNLKARDHSTQKSSPGLDLNVSENKKENSGGITVVETSKQHRPSRVNRGSKVSGSAKSRSCSESLQDLPIPGIEETSLGPLQLTHEEIDISGAPVDPFGLAIWIAQAIRRIHNGVRLSLETDAGNDGIKRSSLSPPELHVPQNQNVVEIAKMAEREKKRDEQRQRKQRWRSEHREENNDNDLRCRINSRAKALYGVNSSVEKTEFMEAEFEKRKARRNVRGSRQARFSGFAFDPEIVRKLFSTDDPDRPHEVNAAGILLVNTLEGIHSNSDGQNDDEAVTALAFALTDSKIDSKPFIEALRILSADSGAMDTINLALKEDDLLANADPDSGIMTLVDTAATSPIGTGSRCASRTAHSHSSFLPPSGLRGGAANRYAIDNHCQSTGAIKALNAATLILSDIAEGNSSHYETPYSNPPPSNGFVTNGITNGTTTTNGGQTKESIEPNSSDQANSAKPSLTKSQIDALLEFANGGSLMDNDDDSLPDVLVDDAAEPGDLETTPQPDSDINATVQRLVTELTADESGGCDQLGFPVTTSLAEKAAALLRLVAEARISKNRILPAAQAHATSQLYAHLSSRAHKFPTSGGINPDHASAYGNTAQMTQRMLARPVNIAPPLQAAPSASRGNVVGPPARGSRGSRGWSSEEVKKIREYGYPPLPGSRPGSKKEQ